MIKVTKFLPFFLPFCKDLPKMLAGSLLIAMILLALERLF